MSGDAARRSSATLLGRPRDPADASAWREFVDRYGPRIYGWCREWRLQEADAEDVTQEVLLKLVQRLRTFTYDPAKSFRGWVYTVTHNTLCDLRESWRGVGRGTGDSCVADLLDRVEAREDLVKRLENEFDRELLDIAIVRVRLRVKPATWQAFSRVRFDGLSVEEAAAELGMKNGTILVYCGRVELMLRDEMARLARPVTV